MIEIRRVVIFGVGDNYREGSMTEALEVLIMYLTWTAVT